METDSLATLALVLAIAGFFFGPLCSIPAIIVGVIVLKRLKNAGPSQSGKTLAIVAVSLAAASIVLGILLMLYFVFILSPRLAAVQQQVLVIPPIAPLIEEPLILEPEPIEMIPDEDYDFDLPSCRSSMEHLYQAIIVYADRNGGALPPPSAWCDKLAELIGPNSPDGFLRFLERKEVFLCGASEGDRCSYGLNANLLNLRIGQLKASGEVVLAFECADGWNIAGDPDQMLSEPRHDSGYVILFANGTVKTIPKEELGQLKWEP